MARSLDRATDESSSARRVSSNGSEAARLTTHPTDDSLLVARPTSARLIRRPSLSPRSLSPASLLSRWKRFQLLSRRPFFARDTSSCPIKSRRTFNELNRSLVRVLAADGPLSATSAVPRQYKPHDQVSSVLICCPVSRRQSLLGCPRQHSIPLSDPNKAPSER